jgi:hypothetical protein
VRDCTRGIPPRYGETHIYLLEQKGYAGEGAEALP